MSICGGSEPPYGPRAAVPKVRLECVGSVLFPMARPANKDVSSRAQLPVGDFYEVLGSMTVPVRHALVDVYRKGDGRAHHPISQISMFQWEESMWARGRHFAVLK